MQTKYLHRIGIILIAASIGVICGYFIFLKHLAVSILDGQAPMWLQSLINKMYPRFESEKNRFDAAFVTEMAFQLSIRWSILFAFSGTFALAMRNLRLKRKFVNFLDLKTSSSNIRILIYIFYTTLLFFFFHGIKPSLIAQFPYLSFYKPISFYYLFHLPFPGNAQLITGSIIISFCYFFILTGKFHTLAAAVFAIVFIYLQGFLFCFEKTSHGLVLLVYSLLLMPFLFYTWSKSTGTENISAWPLRLIQISIALCYFLCGLEKVIFSDFNFIDIHGFTLIMNFHNMPVGLWLAHFPTLMLLIPIFTIIVQLSFPLIFVFNKYKWLFISSVLLFHIGVGLAMGFYGFIWCWGICYIFFLDWSRLSLMSKAYG